jgi:hypothetical protein
MKTQGFFSISLFCLAFFASASFLAVLLLTSPPSTAQDVNTIKSIRTTPSRVEIELYSSRPFPVRALPPVLRMGSKEFTLSRNPEDGSLNTLIFTLTPDEFAQIQAGDQVTVHYGSGELPGQQWDFSVLDNDLLDK